MGLDEVDEEITYELRVDKDDCMSEPASDVTTQPPSTLWSEQASEGSESDHEDAFQESFPSPSQRGTPPVGQVQLFYYMPAVMVAAPATPATQKIQNVPAKCTNIMMVEMLNAAGLSGKYDFVY